MLNFLQDELAGLKLRWLRVLVLMSCLALLIVVAQQERAIEEQRSLIHALSGDRNQMLAHGSAGEKSRIYITDSRILEPKQQTQAPEPAQQAPARPARAQKYL